MTFFAGKRLGPHEALSPSLAPASHGAAMGLQ